MYSIGRSQEAALHKFWHLVWLLSFWRIPSYIPIYWFHIFLYHSFGPFRQWGNRLLVNHLGQKKHPLTSHAQSSLRNYFSSLFPTVEVVLIEINRRLYWAASCRRRSFAETALGREPTFLFALIFANRHSTCLIYDCSSVTIKIW